MKKFTLFYFVLLLSGCFDENYFPWKYLENIEIDQNVSYIGETTIDLSTHYNLPDLSYQISIHPQYGSATLEEKKGILTYRPHQRSTERLKDKIEIIVSNPISNAVLTLHFEVGNTAPYFEIEKKSFNTHFSKPLSLDLKVRDQEQDPMNLSISRSPTHGTASISPEGILTFTPGNKLGIQKIQITAYDGEFSSTLDLEINTKNNAPILTSEQKSITASYKKTSVFSFNAVDLDNDSINIKIIEKPDFGESKIIENSLNFTPDGLNTGKHKFRIQAFDGASTSELVFDINLVNHKPNVTTPIEITAQTTEEIQGNLSSYVSDSDGDNLTYSIKIQPTKGVLTLNSNTGEFTYKPAKIENINDHFIVTVSDGNNSVQLQINLRLTAPSFILEAKEYSSRDKSIQDKFILKGFSQAEFSTVIDNPEEVESFTVNSSGNFKLIAKPYATPIKMEVTAKVGEDSATAKMTFYTQQVNQASDDSDPLYFQQWHLHSTGQDAFSQSNSSKAFDINIGQLHKQGITGKDIEVAVVDSGLEIAHEDLKDNILSNGSYDFVNNDNDPSPEYPEGASKNGDHGTSVAGLIASKGFNNLGGRGVAPDAKLMGLNFLQKQTMEVWIATHGGEKTQNARIINQSYGYIADSIIPLDMAFSMQESWLEEYYAEHPKPALMFKSAGNYFNFIPYSIFRIMRFYSSYAEERISHHISNSDPNNASFYNTVVTALSSLDLIPKSSYASVGSAVMFSAPGGEYGDDSPAMITTDVMGCEYGFSRNYQSSFLGGLNEYFQNLTKCSYTSIFNGTSSSAPVASGVAALIMQANPKMSWRDVRYVMAKTARKVDTKFTPVVLEQRGEKYTAEPGWVTNAAGLSYHNWYGFGMLDATKAVQMATRDYPLLPDLSITSFTPTEEFVDPIIGEAIPENYTGKTYHFTINEDIKVEAIQLKLRIWHNRMSDLAIELTSPSGTKSILATPRHLQHRVVMDQMLFLSHAFLDENAKGQWKLKVIDTNDQKMQYLLTSISPNIVEAIDLSNNSQEHNKFVSGFLKVYGHKK